MGSPNMEQRMRDDAQDLAKTYKQVRDITVGQHVHKPLPNDMCEHKDRLLYESTKRNDKTGSDTPVNTLAQMRYPHRRFIMNEEMGAVIPIEKVELGCEEGRRWNHGHGAENCCDDRRVVHHWPRWN